MLDREFRRLPFDSHFFVTLVMRHKILYFAKGYTQLSERKFNDNSFSVFCFLLLLSGVFAFLLA